MKIILTGVTGLIGGGVLRECLSNPNVTSVITITRKPLPSDISSPKLTTIIHEDFSTYPSKLIDELKGAEACVWSQGIARSRDVTQAELVNHTYPLSGARAFREALSKEGKPFRFIYISGHLAEQDQDANLWIEGRNRKLRGRTEVDLVKLGEEDPSFDVSIMRCGWVLPEKYRLIDYAFGMSGLFSLKSTPVMALAKFLTDAAGKPSNGKRYFTMDEIHEGSLRLQK